MDTKEDYQYDPFFIDIFRTWKTCCEMLIDRGYTIPVNFTKAENNDFFTLYQNTDAPVGFNNYDILGTKDTKQILVKFILDKEGVNTKDITAIRTNVSNTYSEETSIMYIIKSKANTFVNREIRDTDEIFLYTELIFNRTKHRLVPKHTLLTEQEKRDILQTYDCKDTQIPRMVTTDYVCKYFGAKVGDMFKIERPSPSSGFYITYRVVK
jgi:DNA-directed RNA polymerase I, II, and III subunit RPABC1